MKSLRECTNARGRSTVRPVYQARGSVILLLMCEQKLQNVLDKNYFYCWTAWWFHLCISNRITSKYGNPEVICRFASVKKATHALYRPARALLDDRSVSYRPQELRYLLRLHKDHLYRWSLVRLFRLISFR